jgi:YggT family protein
LAILREILNLIIDTAAVVLGTGFLLRAYIQHLRVDPYHPLVRFVMQLTNWAVLPLRRAVPVRSRIDWVSLLCAWLTALAKGLVYSLLWKTLSPLVLLHAVFTMLDWVLYSAFFITLLYVIVSWVAPHSHNAPLLADLVEPLLRPIRRLMPHTQGIDFSPLVLILLIQIGFILLPHLHQALL